MYVLYRRMHIITYKCHKPCQEHNDSIDATKTQIGSWTSIAMFAEPIEDESQLFDEFSMIE